MCLWSSDTRSLAIIQAWHLQQAIAFGFLCIHRWCRRSAVCHIIFSFHRSERYPVSLPFCMCYDRCNRLVISKHGDIQRTCSIELTFACYTNSIAQQISMLSRALLICLLAGSSAAFVEPPVTTVPRTVVRMSGGADAPPPPLKVSWLLFKVRGKRSGLSFWRHLKYYFP